MLRAAAIGGAVAVLSLSPVPGARATLAKPPGGVVRGLDISAYQHAGQRINWGLLARQGIGFAAIKVSEGTYYVNHYYRQDARGAAASGLAVLPYAFANPRRAKGKATARFAVKAMAGHRGRLPLVVDLENDPYKKADDCYGLSVPAMISWISGFTAQARALTGASPIIYTTAAWWRECTNSTARFRNAPLWLAAFGGTPPTVPPPWRHWTFLQYHNNAPLPNVPQADLDYYHPTHPLPTLHPNHPKHPHKPKPRHPKRHRHPKHPKPRRAQKPPHPRRSR